MGNNTSSSSKQDEEQNNPLRQIQEGIKSAANKFDGEEIIDTVCGTGGYFSPKNSGDRPKHNRRYDRSYSDGESDGDGTYDDEDTYTDGSRTYTTEGDDARRPRGRMDDDTIGSASYITEYTDERGRGRSYDTEDDSRVGETPTSTRLAQPLASSFAKRCYFTKAGIGKTTQHYEGLTLTGNVVLMLASAMKLKGCPTICDEDLRRVEQTYPNQFSRLPDELLLSSGWRRISKYCHFAHKPIPDGIPFFHSKERLHPSGGYYFLLAASVGMIRPIDVEPLTKDTLVLLETDYPTQCDATPNVLISDPDQWTLVDKFCFFSGGPINTEEDVYYQADFDGNPIFMLAFLSPSLTPEELYKLQDPEPGLKSLAAVQEVEAVYDLTERDFDDLKLYHLGPCRALPQYILQPTAWTKVLPPHFMRAREQAIQRAEEWQERNGEVVQREIDEEGAFSNEEPDKTPVLEMEPDKTPVLEMEPSKSEDLVKQGAPDPEDPEPDSPTQFGQSQSQQQEEEEEERVKSSSFDDDVGEEKKMQDESFSKESVNSAKEGEEDFVPIKREGYKLGNSSTSSGGPSSPSEERPTPNKSRSRRLMEISSKKQMSPETPKENVMSPASGGTWESEGSSMPGSSVFSEGSNNNSRRALILKMAKARMKKGEEPTVATTKSKPVENDPWTANSFPTDPIQSAQTADTEDHTLDFAADLD